MWGVTPLVVSAYHALAVIHDEYLDDHHAALASLAQGQTQLGQSHPVLENARAMVLYRRQQYKEALCIWEAVLPQWQQERDVTLAFSYRKAEICAIEDNDWRKAAEMARRGEEAAHRAELDCYGSRAFVPITLSRFGDVMIPLMLPLHLLRFWKLCRGSLTRRMTCTAMHYTSE